MKTFHAFLIISTVLVSAILLVPFSYVMDSLYGTRKYTCASMFVDLKDIIKDIWVCRATL